jgi:hypothetical protein
MKNTTLALAAAALLPAGLLTGCTSDPGPGDASSAPLSQSASPNPSSEATDSPSAAASPSSEESVEGTVVRFTAGDASADVTIGEDSPATRDFLSMLPMTLRLEEFNGREKIGDLPRELHWQGSPGSDPEDGDLIYYVPWGNLGFYYDTSGIGYSDQTIHLGGYDASEADLARLEGQETRVEVVE